MKNIGKYLFATLPFFMIMSIFLVVPNVLLLLLMLFFTVIHGPAGYFTAYEFFTNHLYTISVLYYTCALVPAVLWYYFKFYKKDRPFLENRRLRPSSFGNTALLALGASHGVSLLLISIQLLFPRVMNDYSQMMETANTGGYTFTWLLSTLVLPPIVEELVFRGLIMRLIRRAGAVFWVANVLQALLFGIYHMNIVQGIYAFCVGILLGFLAEHYHSLAAGIFFHALFNFFGTVLADLEGRFLWLPMQLLLMIGGVVLTIFAVIQIRKEKPTPPPYGTLRQDPYEDMPEPFA